METRITGQIQKYLDSFDVRIAAMRGEGTVLDPAVRERIQQEFVEAISDVIETAKTDMKLLERQVLHNEKLALLGQIAAGIAHEMGTPLNIISGIAEYLLLDRDQEHPEREDLETVIAQSDKITRLVQDLLAFARHRELKYVDVDLNSEVRKALVLVKGRFEKLGADISLHLGENLPPLSADPAQLQQVLLNVLVNSVDALSDAGDSRTPVLRIDTSAENHESEEEQFLELVVSDNGNGIDRDIIDSIFEPFVSTKEAGEGTGLGLAVCRSIVEQHGGSIRACNNAEAGARFVIHFPAVARGDAS